MSKLNIGIILGSTRQGRKSPQVGKWILETAEKRNDANYEIVDLADYDLPFFGTGTGNEQAVLDWKKKIDELDGFIFIVQEYNHSITGVLKNALDSALEEWNNKVAALVSYGSSGGVRAVEHLRGILAELQVATVRTNPAFSIFTDFTESQEFKPADIHLEYVQTMFDQLIKWGQALKTVRES